jgi:general stress protein 26
MDSETRNKIIAFLSLQKSKLGVISTVNEENKPEAALVYFAFDLDLNLYFVTRDTSRKYKNIMKNKYVSFTAATEDPPQTLQLEGEAAVHSDMEDQKKLYQELIGLASSRNFSAPISQMDSGSLQFVKISPQWIRFGNFEVRKHGEVFEEVKL